MGRRSTYKIKPKASFMRLPPEIRNQVYKLVLPDEGATICLRMCRHYSDKTWSLLALANSNRKIRSELRPLIFQNLRVQLKHFVQYPDFIESFNTHIHENLRPRHIITEVTENDSLELLNWDIHALLQAKNTTPGFRLQFPNEPRTNWERTTGPPRSRSATRAARKAEKKLPWHMAIRPPRESETCNLWKVIREPLFRPLFYTEELEHDVFMRFVTGLRMRWDGDKAADWTMTVATNSGKISSLEMDKLNAYVDMFLKYQRGGYVTVEVSDFKGTLSQQGVTGGGTPLKLRSR